MRVRWSFANNIIIVSNPQGRRSTVRLDRPLTLSRLISVSPSTSRYTFYPIGCSVVAAAIVYPKNVVVVTEIGYILLLLLLLLSVHTSDNIIILLYKHSPGPMEVVSQGHLPCVPCVVVYVRALTPIVVGPGPDRIPSHICVFVCTCVYACVYVWCVYGWCVYRCVYVCVMRCAATYVSRLRPPPMPRRDVRSPNV